MYVLVYPLTSRCYPPWLPYVAATQYSHDNQGQFSGNIVAYYLLVELLVQRAQNNQVGALILD